jgi:hypothetical protein
MAWEVVHGKPVIFDTQSGKVFKTAKQLDDVVQGRIGEAALTRLDNKSLNPLFIQRWLQNG